MRLRRYRCPISPFKKYSYSIKSKFGDPDYIWDDTEDYDSDFPGHTLVYEIGNYALRFIDHDYNDGYYLNTSVNLI